MCRLWKRKKMISLFLLLMVIMVTVSPATGTADETDCKKALMKCLVDAGLSGATVNPYVGLGWATHCIMGYSFCLQYLEEE